jgi:hypothetical protein
MMKNGTVMGQPSVVGEDVAGEGVVVATDPDPEPDPEPEPEPGFSTPLPSSEQAVRASAESARAASVRPGFLPGVVSRVRAVGRVIGVPPVCC